VKLKQQIDQSGLRQTSRQKHAQRRAEKLKKEEHKKYFKEACSELQNQLVLEQAAKNEGWTYSKKTAETISNDIKKKTGIYVAPRSIRECVKRGDAGKSPMKKGPKGRIQLVPYKALLCAVESFATLTQEDSKSPAITRPKLGVIVNAVVNKLEGEGSRTGRTLVERLPKDLADTLELGKPNRIEDRRNTWTTYTNCNMWFESFKGFLIDKGFATANEDKDTWEQLGELIWVDDTQGSRIANIDESALTLDDTKNGKVSPCYDLCYQLQQAIPLIFSSPYSFLLPFLSLLIDSRVDVRLVD
jgi:hypothetical protein